MEIPHNDTKFKHPFCMMVAGPTQSGKTHFVYNLLEKIQHFIDPVPAKIFYCYSVWQPLFKNIMIKIPQIEFYQGLPEFSQLMECVIVIDDLMTECIDNKDVVQLFTIGSHHTKTSVIFITQNVYEKGKYARSINKS